MSEIVIRVTGDKWPAHFTARVDGTSFFGTGETVAAAIENLWVDMLEQAIGQVRRERELAAEQQQIPEQG